MRIAIYVLKVLAYLVFFLTLASILVLAIKLQLGTTNRNNQITKSPPSQRICASTPQLSIKGLGSNTSTPKPDEFGTMPVPAPSATPLPISKITDMATGLSDKEKVLVYVMRCDGSFELFLLDPNMKIAEAILLQQGDVILDWIPPASLLGHEPPALSTALSPTNITTSTPHPPAGTQALYP